MFAILYNIINFFTPAANAASPFDRYCSVIGICATFAGGAEGALRDLAVRVGDFFLVLIGTCSILAVMYGGIKLSSSGGNDQGREEAKKIIMFALLGLILAAASELTICLVWNLVSPYSGATISNLLLLC